MNIGEIIESCKNLFNPSKAQSYLSSVLTKASWPEIGINYAIVYGVTVILQLLSLFVRLFFYTALSSILGGLAGASMAGLTLVGGLIGIAIGLVVNVLLTIILCGLLYLIAKFFKGKGSFMQQFYLQSVVALSLVPISIVLTILLLIPCVNCLALIAALLIIIYVIYLVYLALKVAHSFSSSDALKVYVIYLVIVFIIGLIIFALLFAVGVLTSLMGSSLLRSM